LIGGVPRDLASAFSLGNRKVFVIEGDEYDTAFFDKGSKFLHYHPRFAILNNLEFDHADIFKDLAAIEGQFTKFVGLVENHRNLVVNVDDPGMRSLVTRLGIIDQITSVSGLGQHNDASLVVQSAGAITTKAGSQSANWQLRLKSEVFGSFDLETQLTGVHNASNIAHAIGLLGRLQQEELIGKISIPDLQAIVVRFRGVKRRLEHLNSWNNIDIYEDFAHHPTAVGLVLDGFRASHPGRRILAAFEPKNATSRRNVFTEHFAQSLGKADLVFIGKCPEDSRIAPDQRMDTGKLAKLIGERAIACAENDELGEKLAAAARPGDAIIFMSAGSFSGIQHRLITMIQHGGSK
jgi:UDP-N-acetylmuramate: L-alanyl-gamma-D-glutamyl-meso-diaminopimelate ligase